MRINFYSPVVLTVGAPAGHARARPGRIVNVSSMGTRMVAMGVGAYAASKAALELYTEGLWADLLGTGVTAQLFVPGTTNTEFSIRRRRATRSPPTPTRTRSSPTASPPRSSRSLRSDDFEAYASEAQARSEPRTKRSDPNAFLAGIASGSSPAARPDVPEPEIRASRRRWRAQRDRFRRQGRGGHRRRVGHRQGHGEPVRRRRRDRRLPRPEPRRRARRPPTSIRDCRRGAPTPSASTSATPRTSTPSSSGSSRELGPPHVLCNIAGIGRFARSEEQPVADFSRIIGVNLIGVVRHVARLPAASARDQGQHREHVVERGRLRPALQRGVLGVEGRRLADDAGDGGRVQPAGCAHQRGRARRASTRRSRSRSCSPRACSSRSSPRSCRRRARWPSPRRSPTWWPSSRPTRPSYISGAIVPIDMGVTA